MAEGKNKLAADLLNDEKLLLIESRPDASEILTIWEKLLAFFGKMRSSVLRVPPERTQEEIAGFLAKEFRRSDGSVAAALDCFESIGLIERHPGVISIPDWHRYQPIDEEIKTAECRKAEQINGRS